VPFPSQETRLRKTRVPPTSDDYMIVHRNVQQPARGHQLICHIPVVRARGRIAARVIVDKDDRGCPLRDSLPEHFAGVYQGRIKDTTGDGHVAFQSVLRVENGDVKLFDRKVFEPRGKDRDHVPRRTNWSRLVAAFARQSPAELESRMNHYGTHWAYASVILELGHGASCQSPKRTAGRRQDFLAHAKRRPATPSGTDDDRQQLGRGQRVRAEIHEALAWTVRTGKFTNCERL
jgi:hypothetical protein